MTENEMVYVASYAFGKGYDYEQLGYCDLMHNKQQYIDEVWEYVDEIKNWGVINFKQSYPEATFHWKMG